MIDMPKEIWVSILGQKWTTEPFRGHVHYLRADLIGKPTKNCSTCRGQGKVIDGDNLSQRVVGCPTCYGSGVLEDATDVCGKDPVDCWSVRCNLGKKCAGKNRFETSPASSKECEYFRSNVACKDAMIDGLRAEIEAYRSEIARVTENNNVLLKLYERHTAEIERLERKAGGG